MTSELRNDRIANRGFTLVELIVVVAILAVMVTIAVPYYSNYRLASFNATCLADLKAAKISLEGFYMENQKYP